MFCLLAGLIICSTYVQHQASDTDYSKTRYNELHYIYVSNVIQYFIHIERIRETEIKLLPHQLVL